MLKKIISGVIVMVIGGTTFAVSQSAVVNNFSKNSGLSQQQARQYVDSIQQKGLESFAKVGQSLVDDGNSSVSYVNSIDCINYTYKWETASLSCSEGKYQLQTVGNDEVTLGNCLQSLDTNLGNSAKTTMRECIADIDTVTSDYNLPIVAVVLDNTSITDTKNSLIYNKSVLEAALESN